jgi:hypothetical protein
VTGKLDLIQDLTHIETDSIQFNTTATPLTNAEGLLQWNATDGTLDLGMSGGDIKQQVGQELFIQVYNDTGVLIPNGTPVCVVGRHGNLPKVAPARSDSETTSNVLGLVTQDIPTTGDKKGFVTTFGLVRQIKTNYSGDGNWGTTWTSGDPLYVSKTISGQLTNIEPDAPHHSDVVGHVATLGSAGTGSIEVYINRHKTMEELSDVDGTELSVSGQFYVWNNIEEYFDANYNINDYHKLNQTVTQRIVNDSTPSNFVELMNGVYSVYSVGDSWFVGDTGFGDETTNYTKFDYTGHMTMVGAAQPWEDLRVEPQARTTGVNTPAFEKWYDDAAGTSRGVYLYSFDNAIANNEKEVFFTMQMPHAWNGGTIQMHVHWVPAATENNTDVIWGLEYTWKDIGEVYGDTTLITSSTTLYPDDANITAGKHYISSFAGIVPGTTADGLSSILIGRLFRNSSHGSDTYTNKVGLLYIDAHYQINSIGSNDEYTK